MQSFEEMITIIRGDLVAKVRRFEREQEPDASNYYADCLMLTRVVTSLHTGYLKAILWLFIGIAVNFPSKLSRVQKFLDKIFREEWLKHEEE
jgi:hypothetical protein